MTNTETRYLGCVESYDDSKGFGIIRIGKGLKLSVDYRQIEEPGFKTLKPWQIASFVVRRYDNGKFDAGKVLVEDRGFDLP